MEKEGKELLRKIAKNVAKEEPSILDKKIKTYFQAILEDLPNGDLRKSLFENRKKWIQFFIRSVRRAIIGQKATPPVSSVQQNGVDTDPSHKNADKQNDVEPSSSPKVSSPSERAGGFSLGMTGWKIIQILKGGTYQEETGKQITSLWSQVPDPDAQSELAGLDHHCLMLMMSDCPGDPRVFHNVLHHCFKCTEQDFKVIQHSKSVQSAQRSAASLEKFLKMVLLRRLRYTEDTEDQPSVVDLMVGLLSLYLDLFVIAHREAELTAGQRRRMLRLAKRVMAGAGQKALDALIQMSAIEQDTTYFSPLIRHVMEEKPGKKSCSHYLRYVLTACKWRHLWTQLEDIVAEVRMLRAPKGFVSWVQRWSPEASDQLPGDRKFTGRIVTAFLLDDADANVLRLLKKTIASYERGKEAGQDDNEQDQEEEDTQVTDVGKKKSKKKKKTATVDDGKEQGLDDKVSSLIPTDNENHKADEENISEDNADVEEFEDNVEVFDWTKLGDTEPSGAPDDMNTEELFVIDRGGKRASSMIGSDAAEPAKKKKKKSELTPLPAPGKESSENGAFFIDCGQGKKVKKNSSVHFEESDVKSKKAKKKNKEHEDDDKRDDDEAVEDAETRQEVMPDSRSNQSRLGEEPKKKKKKKESKAGEESSVASAVGDKVMDESCFTLDRGEKNVSSLSTEEPKKKKKHVDGLGSSVDQDENMDLSLSAGKPEKRKKRRSGTEEEESPSGLEPKSLEGWDFRDDDDQGEEEVVVTMKQPPSGGSAERKKRRRSKDAESKIRVEGVETESGETDSHVPCPLSDTPAVTPAKREEKKVMRLSSPVMPLDRSPVVSKLTPASSTVPTQVGKSPAEPARSESDHKETVSEHSSHSMSSPSKKPTSQSPFHDPAFGPGKVISPQNARSKHELSAKRKRQTLDAESTVLSPVSPSVVSIAHVIGAGLEKGSEGSDSCSLLSENTTDPGASTSPLKPTNKTQVFSVASVETAEPELDQGPPELQGNNSNNETIVLDSSSNMDSEVEMVPDLRVHLKTPSPKVSGKQRSSPSVGGSVLSPVYDRKSAGQTGVAGKTESTPYRKKKQGLASAESAGEKEKTAGALAEDRESEAAQKSTSPTRLAKKRKSSVEQRSADFEAVAKKSPVDAKKSPATTQGRTADAESEESKSFVEELGMKNPTPVKKTKSPAEKAGKRRSSVEEAEAETGDLKNKQSVSADTPHDVTKPKVKTPKSTTPVSRRTRSQRASVIPTATKSPKVRAAPTIDSTATGQDLNSETQAPKPASEKKKNTPLLSQTDSGVNTSRRGMRNKKSTPSEENGASGAPTKSSSARRRGSVPAMSTDTLYSTLQKKATRKSTGVEEKSSPSLEREVKGQHSGKKTRFTTLKPVAEKVHSPAKKRSRFTTLKPVAEKVHSPAKKRSRTSETEAENRKETKERGTRGTSPRKSVADKTSLSKSPSLSAPGTQGTFPRKSVADKTSLSKSPSLSAPGTQGTSPRKSVADKTSLSKSPSLSAPGTQGTSPRKSVADKTSLSKSPSLSAPGTQGTSPRKSVADKTSPSKSPSLSTLASDSPDRQTRSQSCKKGYNLRHNIKLDRS